MLEVLKEFNIVSVCFRLVLATLVGAIIGFGRSRQKQTAGMRTYLITCVGAALDQVLRRCKNNRMMILNLQVVSAVRNSENCYRAFVTIRPRLKVNREKLFGDLTGIDGVLSLKEVDQSDDGGDND